MKCQKYRSLISEYIDGRLGNALSNKLLEHIANCKNCKTFYLNELKLKDFIKSSFTKNYPKIDVTSSVMQKINPKKKEKYNKKYYVISASIIFFVFSTLSLFLLDVNKNGIIVSKNKTDTEVEEKKLEEFVLEHIDKANSINVSGVRLSNVVYEK